MTDNARRNEPDDPKTIDLGRRDFAGTSYGANEKEQTDDRRGKNSASEADVADGGVSELLDDDGEP